MTAFSLHLKQKIKTSTSVKLFWLSKIATHLFALHFIACLVYLLIFVFAFVLFFFPYCFMVNKDS